MPDEMAEPQALDPAVRLARWLILAAQRTKHRGCGGFSSHSFGVKGDTREFPQADVEREHFDDFFSLFPDFKLPELIREKDLLDVGCGYGGKTVEFVTRCGARRACGIEPHPRMIEQAQRYASTRNATNVSFEVCGERDIPYADDTFDIVLSHDVLEHVADPRVTIAEIHRVLRPGGLSFNVFPLYWGAKSHHLDYVTTMPALHWMFSPRVLVRAVNTILATRPDFGTARQPLPRTAFDGAREVLPGLNGLSGEHLPHLFGAFEVLSLRRIALGPRGMGMLVRSQLPTRLRDMATATVACVLRKGVR